MTAQPDIAIVGGVYDEIVRDIGTRRLRGSGMRAAALVAGWHGTVPLHTRLDAGSAGEAGAVAAAAGVALSASGRPGRVAFDYPTGLARPTAAGIVPTTVPVQAAADVVIAFGMAEGPWSVEAETLVVDAQHSSLADCGLADSSFGRAALVVNHREIRQLAGSPPGGGLGAAARRVARDGPFEVVVVKCGARGALVVHGDDEVWVPAVVTPSVAALGTGDAFTGAFGYAWGARGAGPAEAAAIASTATAWHAVGSAWDVPPEALDGQLPPGGHVGAWLAGTPARVYLAGAFFSTAEKWLVDTVRDGLHDIGADVFSPWHDVGEGGDEVAAEDLNGLATCQAVLALVDGDDPGTLFECGWSAALAVPVSCLSRSPESKAWTMLRGTGAEISDDLVTAAYRAAWAALTRSAQSPPPP